MARKVDNEIERSLFISVKPPLGTSISSAGTTHARFAVVQRNLVPVGGCYRPVLVMPVLCGMPD